MIQGDRKMKDFNFRSTINLFLLISCFSTGASAYNSDAIIRNFSKETYRASSQNWSVEYGVDGSLYFANHRGLLEFDGINWELYKLPNETILRCVKIAADSTIYTSGYRELGYWKKDLTGHLQYFSLNEQASQYFTDNEEFWNISILKNEVYFRSFTNILHYTNDSIVKVESPGFINNMHRVRDDILLASEEFGISKIENNQTVPIIEGSVFNGMTPRFILPYKEDQLMIGTKSNGIFIWDGNQLKQWNEKWTAHFRKNEVNRGYITSKGYLIVGTILDGIIIFDQEGNYLNRHNTSNGLQNNTVLGITTDRFNNIWLALDGGIDFISENQNFGFIIEKIPEIGAVYDAAIFEDKIYLGTNQGLFERDIYDTNAHYQLVPESQNQVWFCNVIDDQLFAGHNDGTLIIKNDLQKFVSRQSGAFTIRQDPLNPNLFFESTYSDIVRLKKQNNKFTQDGIVKNFVDLIRFLEIDHLGDIWASHMHRGVFKLQLNDERDSVITSKYYGENSVFGKDHSIHVFKIENRIVFTTEERLYTYNDLSDTIIPYQFLNEQLGEFKQAKRIIPAPDHHYWFITKSDIGLYQIFNNTVKFIKNYPRSLFVSNELIDDFENIFPLTATKAIVCLENGIAQLDAAVSDSSSMISEFKPRLSSLTFNGNRGQTLKSTITENKIFVKYKYHNIQLSYAFPYFTHTPIYFQSFLKGLDQNWSKKTTIPDFSFDRIPSGEYELLVKASDQWGNESQFSSFQIEIAPPWYLTNYAKASYLFTFIALMFGVRSWSINKTKKKERLQHQKKERELIQLRNEKLRNEIQHKSKELANSTMAIIKKNEFLIEIKQIIAKQKEQLGSRYPDKFYYQLSRKIEENISSYDDWQVFEMNFERAHEQFLNKIKEMHPELTSKDLRLCAYLRMNLSSKEIAPLLGISVRGVENHRYRVRKKMKLEHDEKLIDFIIEL